MAVFLLLALGVCLGAVALEVVVRSFIPVSDSLWEFDAVVGMTLIPGRHGRWVKPGIFDAPVEINSAGFRDREHELTKPAGTRRVLLLGASFVEALQVPF